MSRIAFWSSRNSPAVRLSRRWSWIWPSALSNTPLEELDPGINNALAMAGSEFDVDRVYLFLYDFDAGIMRNTHEWCAPGITPEIDNLQAVPNGYWPTGWFNHTRGELIHIPRLLDLPEAAGIAWFLNRRAFRPW